jgi:hypothetical protein
MKDAIVKIQEARGWKSAALACLSTMDWMEKRRMVCLSNKGLKDKIIHIIKSPASRGSSIEQMQEAKYCNVHTKYR